MWFNTTVKWISCPASGQDLPGLVLGPVVSLCQSIGRYIANYKRGGGGEVQEAGPAECYVSWKSLLNPPSSSAITASQKSLEVTTGASGRLPSPSSRPLSLSLCACVRVCSSPVIQQQRRQQWCEMSGVKKLRTVSRSGDERQTERERKSWNTNCH